MNQFLFLILILAPFLALTSVANQTCVNDKTGSKGVSDTRLNDLFEKADDALTKEFKLFQKTTNANSRYCADNSTRVLTVPDNVTHIGNLAPELTTKTEKIKKQCVEAALQAEVNNVGYICDGKNKIKFKNTGKSAPCLNQKIVDFLHYSLNRAINCISTDRDPIDPRFILKKMNNESGFNFFVADSEGVGMGQLTSDPVKQIAGTYEKGKPEKGGSYYILEDVINSTNPSCKPFADILRKDLMDPPLNKKNQLQQCTWLTPGSGVARNMMYSLMYYAYLRDKVIKPALEKRGGVTLASNKDLVNYLTLTAYGKGATSRAKAIIKVLRFSNKSDPSQTVNDVKEESEYVKETESRMQDLLDQLKKEFPAEYNKTSPDKHKRGDTCIEP